MDTINIIVILVIIMMIGFVLVVLTKSKNETSNNEVEEIQITSNDLKKHIKEVYSNYIPWDNSIGVKSAYVLAKKEFANKLLENINNKEEFLRIFNSDFLNQSLLNLKLDKKFDVIEQTEGVPVDLSVNFDKFNIKNGSLTDKIEKLIIEWYKDGVQEIKEEFEYQVKSENWDRIKKNLEKVV